MKLQNYFRIAYRSALIVFAVVILLINLKLYSPSPLASDHSGIPRHAVAQLSWVKGQLKAGSGTRMQYLFPEGYFFSYTLYGLAWIELGLRDETLRETAISEARWSLKAVESEKGKSPFPESLPPDHGMFYSAWRNHLLSGIVLLQFRNGDEPRELELFKRRCSDIASTFRGSVTNPFPESYMDAAWPCDSPPGIHSLCIYRAVTGDGQFDDVVKRWILDAKSRFDPSTQLLPHRIAPDTDKIVDGTRGSSQVIILRFLLDIDPDFAVDQYSKFRELFFSDIASIPAIREFPKGVNERGDVDSGPLFFGISFSSTVVGMGVAQIYGDHKFAEAVSQVGEVIGAPFGRGSERRYLGGVLPIGDTFLVHATTARPWLGSQHPEVKGAEISVKFWRWKLHFVSLIGLGIILVLLLRRTMTATHS